MHFFKKSCQISGIVPIDQYSHHGGKPLPTGCEMTAAAVLLNFYGFGASKNLLAQDFLPKAPVGKADPHFAFLGNPEREENSFGVYAPAAAKAMERFLLAQYPENARGVRLYLHTAQQSGAQQIRFTLTNVCKALRWHGMKKHLRAGTPLMVWMTMNAEKPTVSKIFLLNRGTRHTASGWGKYLVRWVHPQHCAVLCGYDTHNHVIICDVAGGVFRKIPKSAFLRGYRALGAQCIRMEHQTREGSTKTDSHYHSYRKKSTKRVCCEKESE